MKLFVCQACDNVLYFENRACERCGHRVAFLPEKETMSAIEPDGEAQGGTSQGGTSQGGTWSTLANKGESRIAVQQCRVRFL
ncbi:hypothetical protein ACVWW4_008756 [Bradyrhizobium sp. LB7.1]